MLSSNNFVSLINNFIVIGNLINGWGVEINDFYLQQGKGVIVIIGMGMDGFVISNQQFLVVYFGVVSVVFIGILIGLGYGLFMELVMGSSLLVYISIGDFQVIGQNV